MKFIAGILAVAIVAGGATAIHKAQNKTSLNTRTTAVAPVGKALIGSPDFRPSPERPIGWRGDGSGRYPGATPPIRWSHWPKGLKDLRCRAGKPKTGSDTDGTLISHGIIHDWLMLGPIARTPDVDAKVKAMIPDESALRPNEGDKAGNLAWKRFETRASKMYPAVACGAVDNSLVYLHSYVYSPTAVDAIMYGYGVPWINGKFAGATVDSGIWPHHCTGIRLEKGWNSILFKVGWEKAHQPNLGFVAQIEERLYTAPRNGEGANYVSENIRWMTKMPATSHASPIVVGDRVFVQSERTDLICLDSRTGKIIWLRPNTYFEGLNPEDRKQLQTSNSAAFSQIEQANTQLRKAADDLAAAINAGVSTVGLTPEQLQAVQARVQEKAKLEDTVNQLMRQLDSRKYAWPSNPDCATAAVTPCSDGKYIYCWFTHGVVVCYDLEGKKQWSQVENDVPYHAGEHGSFAQPGLMSGKFIIYRNRITAFDCKTGSRCWRTEKVGWGGSFVRQQAPDRCLVVPAGLLSLADGKLLNDGASLYSRFDTPIVEDDIVYHIDSDKELRFFAKKLPSMELVKSVMVTPGSPALGERGESNCVITSPLYHDGLLYSVNGFGVLHVVDFKTGAVVYEKLLDIDPEMNAFNRAGVFSSLTMAGNNIYVTGTVGTTIVFRPGRTYVQLAKNVLDHYAGGPCLTEQTWSNPVFDGNQMFFRAHQYMYCVAEGAK